MHNKNSQVKLGKIFGVFKKIWYFIHFLEILLILDVQIRVGWLCDVIPFILSSFSNLTSYPFMNVRTTSHALKFQYFGTYFTHDNTVPKIIAVTKTIALPGIK